MNTYQADDQTEWVNHDSEADCLSCPRDSEHNLTMFAAQAESSVVQGCSACPAGKEAGSTECVNCVAGQVSSSATYLKCEDCKVGYYQDQKGFPSCSKCIPGEYQKKEGKTKVSGGGGGVCLFVDLSCLHVIWLHNQVRYLQTVS